MDMKDLVLSTLSYLEKNAQEENKKQAKQEEELTVKNEYVIAETEELKSQEENIEHEEIKNNDADMLRFLTSLRERILVLFEGLQSPNNRNIEAKIDLILNFLEYQLSIIDVKLEELTQEEHENKKYS